MKRKIKSLTSVTFSVFMTVFNVNICFAQSGVLDNSVAFDYPPGGVLIGQGFSFFDKVGTSESCVQTQISELEQSSYSTEMTQVVSSLDVEKKVNASASASYGSVASAKVSMSRSSKVNSDFQNFLFSFFSNNGSTFAVGPGMTHEKINIPAEDFNIIKSLPENVSERLMENVLLSTSSKANGGSIKLTPSALGYIGQAQKFQKRCGDGYVSAIIRGVQVDVLLTHQYKSQSDKSAMSAKIKASGYGASGSASYSSSGSKTATEGNLSYKVFQKGGTPLPLALIGYDDSGSQNRNLDLSEIFPNPSTFITNPTAFSVIVTPYSSLSNTERLPNNYTPVDLFSFRDYYIVLSDIYDQIGDIVTDQISNGDIVADDNAFDSYMIRAYGGVERLIKLRDQIHWDLEFIEVMIEKCRDNRALCKVESNLKNVKSTYDEKIKASETKANFIQNHLKKLVRQKNGKPLSAEIDSLNFDKIIDSASFASRGDIIDSSVLDFQSELDVVNLDNVNDYEVIEAILSSSAVADQLESQKRIRSYINSEGKLSDKFYDKFYYYLVNIPIPKAMYATAGFEALKNDNVKVFVDQQEDAIATWIPKANDQLRNVIYTQRITPWRNYFCERLQSAPLCYPDSTLFNLVSAGIPSFSEDDSRISTKPRAKKKKKKKRKPQVRDSGPINQ